mmetsp:Transcript_23351/g.17778  ORF Transcript_23351/g.17778 Transcript_23351/m.17778 type:complete len:267 (-) Transcript_23351:1160-1960(-)
MGTSHIGHATWSSTSSLIDSHHNWVVLGLKFFLLGFNFLSFSIGRSLKPLDAFFGGLFNDLLVILSELILELLIIEGVLHLEAVVFQTILGFNSLLDLLIFTLVLFSFIHHSFNIILAQSSLFIGNGDFVALSGPFVSSRDIHDTIGINIESDFDLRNASGSGRNTFQVEFSKHVVVLGHASLTFIHLDEHTWLIVSIGSEDLALLGWNGGVTRNQHSHDTSSSLNSEGKRSNIEKKQVLHILVSFASQNSSLNCSTIGDCLIRVD